MRQTYTKVLTFLSCTLCGISAIATNYVVDGITYLKKTDSTVWVNKTDGSYTYSGDIVIPSSITVNDSTFNVEAIGSYSFQKCTEVTSVTINEGIIKIFDLSFSGCSALKSVKLPESLTLIGNSSFSNCSSLTEITIPENCLSLYQYMFSGCSSLQSVKLPSKLTSIPSYFFENCTSLAHIEIPANVTYIPNGCFKGCTSLSSVELSAGITSIGSNSFDGCSSLTTISLPETLKKIPNYAFQRSGLTEITIPENVTSIGNYAFYECPNLETVNILGSPSVGNRAFSFDDTTPTTYIATLNAPKGLGTIDTRAFYGQKSMKTKLKINGDKIGMYAFNGCAALDSIDIKCGQIETKAFENCSGITYASIDCQTITNDAFSKVSKINTLNINCPTIPANTFTASASNLKYLGIGEKVENLNSNFNTCYLYRINISTPTPPTGVAFSKKDTHTLCHVILNGEWVDTYQQADGWKDIFYIIADWDKSKATLIDGIYYNFTSENTAEVVAGETAYTGAITIPATIEYEGKTYNITAIRSEAFYNSNISSISLPEGIEKIGVGAFYGCKLKKIKFPNSLAKLGAHAFGTSSIEEITWGTGLTTLEGMAFFKASYPYYTLNLTIPSSITDIKYGAFGGWASKYGLNVTIECVTPPTTDTGAFDGAYTYFGENSDYAKLYVPAGTLDAYSNAEPWCYFGRIIDPSDESSFEYDGLLYEVIDGTENEAQLVANSYNDWEIVVPATVKNGDKTYTVTRIAEYAFAETQVEKVTIPSTIKTIGEEAFMTSYYWMDLYCNAAVPPTLESSYTFNFDRWFDKNLYVPAGAEEAYAAADQWKEFSIFTDNTGVESIDIDNNNIVVNGNEININGNRYIEVYNISGKLVYAGNNTNISVPAGIYIVKANNTINKVIIH